MISFFRKVRQQLLTGNRVSKYLLYALGEIFLVVIGILIALQVNNWNEERKSNRLKETYLSALSVDVQSDIANLKAWKQGNDQAEEEGLYLLEFLEERMVDMDSQRLVRSFLLCQYKPAITISSSTYRDLNNSGNIQVFEDLDFKKILDEYYKTDTWSSKIDDRITQTIWYDFRDRITQYIDPTIYKAIYTATANEAQVEELDLLQYEIDWNSISKSPEILRELRNVLAFRIVIRGDLQAHIQKAQELLRTIQAANP